MRSDWKNILIVFVIAFLLRSLVLGAWWQAGYAYRLSGDSDQYYKIGENLVHGVGYQLYGQPTARRVPVYPLFVAFFMKLGIYPHSLQLAQAFLGALSCVLLVSLGTTFFGARVGFIAGFLQATDYLLTKQIVYILPEIVFVFLILIASYLFIKAQIHNNLWWSAGSAAIAALTVLTKEMLSLYFLILPVLFFLNQQSARKNIQRSGIFLAVYLAVLTPWILRNHQVYHQWTSLSINSGHAFYQGNNPGIRMRIHGGDWIEGHDTDYPENDPDLPPLSTLEADRYLMKKSMAFIRENPGRFVQLAALKAFRLWHPYFTKAQPWAKGLMIISYFVVVPFSILGIILSKSRWREFMFVYLLIAYVTLIHAVTIPSIRYRYPLMPFLMMFAAFGIQEIWQRKKQNEINVKEAVR